MNKSILSLVGAVDSLLFLLEDAPNGRKKKQVAAVCRRLDRMRATLLAEGVRQMRVLRNARETIREVADQLDAHLPTPEAMRDVDWIVSSLDAADILASDPPPLPSSSSSSGAARMEWDEERLGGILARALAEHSFHARSTKSRANRTKRSRSTPARGKRATLVMFPNGDNGTI